MFTFSLLKKVQNLRPHCIIVTDMPCSGGSVRWAPCLPVQLRHAGVQQGRAAIPQVRSGVPPCDS